MHDVFIVAGHVSVRQYDLAFCKTSSTSVDRKLQVPFGCYSRYDERLCTTAAHLVAPERSSPPRALF